VKKKSILRLKQDVFCILFQLQNFKRIKSMTVKLLCFGITKEMIGAFEKVFELPENSTVKSFKEQLEGEFPALKNLNSLRIAVNEAYAEESLELMHRDEVVLIPPVSGG
jgi:molybdopterin synthase sulfur carrier subunit